MARWIMEQRNLPPDNEAQVADGDVEPLTHRPHNALVHYIKITHASGTGTQQEQLDNAIGDLVRVSQENGANVEIHSLPFEEATASEARDEALRHYAQELAAHFAMLNQGLSLRRRQVLAHLAEGASNRVIGAQMNLSQHTVKTHLSKLGNWVGGSSRHEIVAQGLNLYEFFQLLDALGIKLDTETPDGR